MFTITDDPVADFYRYDAEMTDFFSKLPTCCECGEPIQDEICYEINGDLVCEECLKLNYAKMTEDYYNN